MMVRFACAVALAAVATAAHAADSIPGSAAIVPSALSFNVSAYGGLGHGTYANGGGSWNLGLYGAEAHVGTLRGAMGIAGDIWGGASRYDVTGSPASSAYFLAAGIHLNRRTGDGLFGALVSIGVTPQGYNDTFLNTALEAQKDFGRLTLGVQGGYAQTIAMGGPSDFSISAPNALYVDGIGRWFADENLMLAGELGYAWVTGAAGQTASTPRWLARLEYKPKTIPVAAFVAYQGYHWDQTGAVGTVHALTVGLTFIGGGETLAGRYRGAAGLEDRNPIYGVNYEP